jgi:hypothetical protein
VSQRIDQPSLHRQVVTSAIAALLALGVIAQPATAAETGTVAADVTLQAATACIELSTSSITFGTLGFGEENVAATPNVTVTNCSTTTVDLLASGTNATGPEASWNLVSGGTLCDGGGLGTDNYRLDLYEAGFEDVALVHLQTSNNAVQSLDPGASATHSARIWTACPGSSGDGKTLTFQVNYVAVADE